MDIYEATITFEDGEGPQNCPVCSRKPVLNYVSAEQVWEIQCNKQGQHSITFYGKSLGLLIVLWNSLAWAPPTVEA